ncbi:MAG: ferredoxin family protein [Thermincola sp.]|nr:ferredoxin family protein [Thermincola sp.]MDT3704968.1 ferredoxin family protein [Thermincola sp.]
MTVRIDAPKCNGCGNAAEPLCVRVCPGDLLYRDQALNRCAIRDPRDCWDCAACLKECPRQAIEMTLPVQVGGSGSSLRAHLLKDRIIWTLTRKDGTEEKFEILNHR